MSELVGTLGRVGVLYGGVSSEREISLASGSAVSESLQRLSIENILIDAADDFLNKLELFKPDRMFADTLYWKRHLGIRSCYGQITLQTDVARFGAAHCRIYHVRC